MLGGSGGVKRDGLEEIRISSRLGSSRTKSGTLNVRLSDRIPVDYWTEWGRKEETGRQCNIHPQNLNRDLSRGTRGIGNKNIGYSLLFPPGTMEIHVRIPILPSPPEPNSPTHILNSRQNFIRIIGCIRIDIVPPCHTNSLLAQAVVEGIQLDYGSASVRNPVKVIDRHIAPNQAVA